MTFLLLLSSSFLVLSKLRITNDPTCSDHSSNILSRCRDGVTSPGGMTRNYCAAASTAAAGLPGAAAPEASQPGLRTEVAATQTQLKAWLCAGHWDGPVGRPLPHTALGLCPGFPADVPGAPVPSWSYQPAEPERSLRLGSTPRWSPASQLGSWQHPRCTSPSATDH